MSHNPYSVGEQQTYGDVRLQGPKLDAAVRTMQIIAVALMMGVLTFLLVVFVVMKGDVGGMQNAGMITMIAAGFGFLMIVNHFVIPPIVTRTQLKQSMAAGLPQQQDEARVQQLCAIYKTQLIIGLALLEGAAFFNLIAMLLEKCVASLGVVILLLCLMLVKFPTQTKVSWWVQDKLSELQ